MATTEKINIYAYDDFRLFLKHGYEARRKADPSYSARKFAAQAGLSNPGFLNDVIKGRRRLSAAAREKMIAAFCLVAAEAEYFRLLVEYGQARRDELRQDMYRKILFRRNRSAFTRLNPAISRYYQDYRYPLVYNALMAFDFRGDYEELSRFIYPPVPVHELRKYVNDLCEWDLVSCRDDGRYCVRERFVEPPPTLREHVRQLNRQWISHAMDALMKLPPEKRHMSTMLLSVSPAACKRISEKIEQFREEIWELLKDDQEEAAVIMQLNLQYFPRSRKNKEQV